MRKKLVELCECDVKLRLAYLKKKCVECYSKKHAVEYKVDGEIIEDKTLNERFLRIAKDSITEFLSDDENFKYIYVFSDEIL